MVIYRDPETDWSEVFAEIRRAGYGTGDICEALNVPRGTLRSWEIEGCCPNFEHGKTILRFLEISRKSDRKTVLAIA